MPVKNYCINKVILTHMIHLRSAVTLYTKQKSIAPFSGLLNEVLCILVATGTAKWWEVNLEVRKNVSSCLNFNLWRENRIHKVNKLKSTLISIIETTQMKRAGGNCSLFYKFSLLYVLGKTLALLRMSPLMSTFFLKIWLEKGS